jgi:DNA modification methylase
VEIKQVQNVKLDYRKAVPTVYNSEKGADSSKNFQSSLQNGRNYRKPLSKIISLLKNNKNQSNRGDLVLDPFQGTLQLAVAKELNRNSIGDELPRQIIISLRRF